MNDMSYKARRNAYYRRFKGTDLSERGYTEDICNGVLEDYTLSINDTTNILGFTVEHVQNYVLQNLDVINTNHDIKRYMGNNRLKRVVSKSSLESYISSQLAITDRREVIEIAKTEDIVSNLKDILGKRAKIQLLLEDAAVYLEQKYDVDSIVREKIKNRKDKKIDNEYINEDLSEIVDYCSLDDIKGEDVKKQMMDIYVDDMYSIRELKELLGKKHTMQVYRFLHKISHIAVKINSDYISSSFQDREKSDRNIRYIITKNNLKLSKNVYRLSINYYVLDKIKQVAAVKKKDFNEILSLELCRFAEENKEKYIKKEKKED